jgi:hypothetical protein
MRFERRVCTGFGCRVRHGQLESPFGQGLARTLAAAAPAGLCQPDTAGAFKLLARTSCQLGIDERKLGAKEFLARIWRPCVSVLAHSVGYRR